MRIHWLGGVLLVAVLAGCGGGGDGTFNGSSGVDPDKTIGELNDEELEDVCTYFAITEPSPPREIDCFGMIYTVGIERNQIQGRINQCIDELSQLDQCIATVAEAEECVEALDARTAALSDDEFCAALMVQEPPLAVCATFQDISCEPGANE